MNNKKAIRFISEWLFSLSKLNKVFVFRFNDFFNKFVV